MKSPLVYLFIAISIVGCGAAQKTATPQTIDMEPVIIEVKDKDGRREVNTYDAESLFNEAKTAYQAEQFSACIEKYTQLLAQFTQSRFVVSARFNRGLCYEESLQHGPRSKIFDSISTRLKQIRISSMVFPLGLQSC